MPVKKKEEDSVSIDLTPMIDVVFQLLIFFIVVTQITSNENVALRLPDALTANPEDKSAKKMFTVHIAPVNQAGAEDMPDQFGWFCYGELRPRTIDEMKAILEVEAAIVDPARDLKGIDPATGISENQILVRCDARAPAGEFGKLIELMVGAMMYRIKIGIMKDPTITE
jgi:biopolymer transport protein ExbD